MQIEIGSEWITDRGEIIRVVEVRTDETDGVTMVRSDIVASPGSLLYCTADSFERYRPALRERPAVEAVRTEAGRIYFGQAGHFVDAARCRFHLHTHVNGFCVSTVGEYHPLFSKKQEPVAGARDALYETMVFLLGAGGEPEGDPVATRHYSTRDAANEGHEREVRGCEPKGGSQP